MAITFHADSASCSTLIKRRLVAHWVRTVAAGYGFEVGDIAYIFCSEEGILTVNQTYLQHDYYTDIISFDYTEGTVIGGDLYLSPETIRSNARQVGASFREELHRVLIHGVLHLCGLKDKTPEARAVMEAAENSALALLKEMIDDPKR